MTQLILHFSQNRKRVHDTGDERHTKKYVDKTPAGQIRKYLNKLTPTNYVVVSHGIFRLLVDDSSTNVALVFDCLLKYAFVYPQNSELIAMVCANVGRMYDGFASHVNACISGAHETLRGVTDVGVANYTAYLDDVANRSKARGCFVFVCNLYTHGVVTRATLLAEMGRIVGAIEQSIANGVPSPPVLQAYADCLIAMVQNEGLLEILWRRGTTRVRNDTPGAAALAERLKALVSRFEGRRDRAFPSRAWFTFVDALSCLKRYWRVPL